MRLIILAFVLFLASCQKEYSFESKPTIIGTWEYTDRSISPAFDWNADGVKETNIYSAMTTCTKAYSITFKKDLTGNELWDCNSIGKNIKYAFDGEVIKYGTGSLLQLKQTVTSLTKTTMITTQKVWDDLGNVYTITNSYVRK